MLRTSLREPTTDPIEGATDVIEAETAEAAIAKVHEQLGPDARILDARRELRGGVGGFFAKEVVQLHAAPAAADPGHPAAAPANETPAVSPVDRLLAAAPEAPETVDFATFLRDRMGRDELDGTPTRGDELSDAAFAADDAAPSSALSSPVSEAPVEPGGSDPDPNVAAWRAAAAMLRQGEAPTGGVVDPVTGEVAGTAASPAVAQQAPTTAPLAPERLVAERPAPAVARSATAPLPSVMPAPASSEPTIEDAVAYEPGPSWSQERLLQLGLPTDLVRALGLGPEEDDIAWTMALATQLVSSCGPVPTGPAMLIGPRAGELSEDVGGSTARSELWFDALKEGRWLHLVVGGEGWREHLRSGPRVVSWSRPGDLPEALRCALELGLTLGYGPLGGVVRRARPVDVAFAVRDLVDGR